MSQHDYSLANQSPPSFRGDMNFALVANAMLNSGASAPSTTFAYMLWADTSTGLLKIRNSANTNWVDVGVLASSGLGLLALSGGQMSGALTLPAFADLASSGTTSIGGTTTNFVRITGTTTITSFGTIAAGVWRLLRFASALTLTHNGTSLILPGAANISTAANDCAWAISLGSGNWIVVKYMRASGRSVTPTATPTVVTTATHSLVQTDHGKTFVYTTACSVQVANPNSLQEGWYCDLYNGSLSSSTLISIVATHIAGYVTSVSSLNGTYMQLNGRPGMNRVRFTFTASLFRYSPRVFYPQGIGYSPGISASGITHGLAMHPTRITAFLHCTSGDAGYLTGQIVATSEHPESSEAANGFGLSMTSSSNNTFGADIGANGIYVNNAGTGVSVALTTGRWDIGFIVEGD